MAGSKNTGVVLLCVAFICMMSFLMSPKLPAIAGTKRCGTVELVRHVRVGGEVADGTEDEYEDESDEDEEEEVFERPVVPEFKIDPIYQDAYDRIDNESPAMKCTRYGMEPLSPDAPKRRIFYGTMVANENWEVLEMTSIEVHGLYHTAVFVESNTTHMATPRKMRYYDSEEKNLLMYSGMLGKDTRVIFDYWLEDKPELIYMDREAEQRNSILRAWKDAGMKPQDVGLMADVDEVFSRDFLQAVLMCDVEQLRPGQTCQKPKVVPAAISFESSPFCFKKREWFHPDIINGECIEGIGDPTERVVPLRNFKRRYGERSQKYGAYDNQKYPEDIIKSGRFPLFSGPDIRTVHGDRGYPYSQKDRPGEYETAAYGAAFHFHNWFKDLAVLRNKYLTYAHGDQHIMQKTLSQASEDLDGFVRCMKGLDNSAQPNDWKREVYDEGWNVKGPKPIFFLNEAYTKERHALVKKMLEADEKIYGSGYDANGKWVENTLAIAKEDEEQAKRRKIAAEYAAKTKKGSRNTKKASANPKDYGSSEYSKTATVMGMATGLNIEDYRKFVGSLRRTGYGGNIILGVNADTSESILEYLSKRDVITKFITYSDCTFEPFYKTEEEIEEARGTSEYKGLTKCTAAYPDVKVRWAKFPMGRDWLRECETCTGPVMITDVRDTIFQRDPFGAGSVKVKGLQVFEEHPDMTTEHWLVDWPVEQCKGVHLKKPMLCSGTTIGTLSSMNKYLDKMYEEMKAWLADPKCRLKTLADDQSIHNWLFYNDDIDKAVAIPHREGIVNTVGYEGSKIFRENVKEKKENGMDENEANSAPFPGKSDRTWISSEQFGLTTEDGEFTNSDGTVSAVVHQYDRLGLPFLRWMKKQGFATDDVSSSTTTKKSSSKFEEKEPSASKTSEKKKTSQKSKTSEDAKEVSPKLSKKSKQSKPPIGGNEESRYATVMGMATGLHIFDLEGFVGSLRQSGFSGNIILGINEDAPQEVLNYLKKRNVITKIMRYTNCTFEPFYTPEEMKTEEDQNTVKGLSICAEQYPDVKVRWIKFPLGRDWLRECETCTGPVLIADVRDLYFQDDPFGPGAPEVKGLQVFEEHLNTSTEHWLVDWPVGDCKGVHFKKPMLCSGTTIGTLDAMLKYLDRMYEEMKLWLSDPKCRFRSLADDQSIHNWLFYNGDLEDAIAVNNREGIVQTVGFEADIVFSGHIQKLMAEKNMTHDQAFMTPLAGGETDRTWISSDIYGMTDEDGFFTNFDGSRSRVVHQWDRAGYGFEKWMQRQDFMKDRGQNWMD